MKENSGDLAKVLWQGDRAIALRQAIGPREVRLALGERGCGVDFGGPDGLMLEGIDWRNPQLTWRPKSGAE